MSRDALYDQLSLEAGAALETLVPAWKQNKCWGLCCALNLIRSGSETIESLPSSECADGRGLNLGLRNASRIMLFIVVIMQGYEVDEEIRSTGTQ